MDVEFKIGHYMCFVGIVLWGKGTPMFLPRLTVFATAGGNRVSTLSCT